MKNIIGKKENVCALYTQMLNTRMVGEGSEIKSGRLCVIQEVKGRKMKVQVFVRVYRSCFEHYVVMFKDSKLSLQCGFINLKNCVITKCTGKDTQFRVTLNDFEGTGVVFETSNWKETEEWQEALQPVIVSSSPTLSSISPNLSPVIPRSPLMPTVTEESDEES